MEIISELTRTFGSFRAENLGDQLFSFYTTPDYFPKLVTPIPCLLQGGRGTGKTTVLKSLSFEGQYRLANQNFDKFIQNTYVGIYYKLETGLVSAFSGAGKPDSFWQQIFAHFMNLQLCKQVCEFAVWYEEKQHKNLILNPHLLEVFCISIGITSEKTLSSILLKLDLQIAKLESDINYASDTENTKQIPIGAPTRRLVKLLRNTHELKDKTFYFLLDEYENLRDYQQATLNTFIKQSDIELTFKIGIRELGFKTRHTLNEQEQLVDPADYVLIDIATGLDEKEFESFSRQVLEHRFDEIRNKFPSIPKTIPELFEELSEEQEAVKLGVDEIANRVIKIISKKCSMSQKKHLKSFNARDLALMKFLAGDYKDNEDQIYQVFSDAITDPSGWRNKVNNYGYAALFSIRRKKVGISKYYCGWKTFVMLSAGNIRYLLQLVINSLITHAKENKQLDQKISAKCQTNVAMEVGKKNLMELEGLSTQGAQLMKLVLGMGQVLHEMAIQGEGHAPEITQFEMAYSKGTKEMAIEVSEMLNNAVMHLALLRTSGTKLGSPGATKDFDYMLHPIFSPFFVYSHRKKRKFTISPDDLLGIIDSPPKAIKRILIKQNRETSNELSDQLQLFGGYYEGNL
jgi:hypothetical protein